MGVNGVPIPLTPLRSVLLDALGRNDIGQLPCGQARVDARPGFCVKDRSFIRPVRAGAYDLISSDKYAAAGRAREEYKCFGLRFHTGLLL